MATRYQIQPQKSQVTLVARSSIHDVHVSNGDLSGEISLDRDQPGDAPALAVTLTMKGFDAGDWLKTRTLHNYLEVKKFPVSSFRLSSATVSAQSGQTISATLSGELQFMGRSIALNVDATGEVDAGKLVGDAQFSLFLPDLGLKAPSFMFVKMDDTVRVQVHLDARATT